MKVSVFTLCQVKLNRHECDLCGEWCKIDEIIEFKKKNFNTNGPIKIGYNIEYDKMKKESFVEISEEDFERVVEAKLMQNM